MKGFIFHVYATSYSDSACSSSSDVKDQTSVRSFYWCRPLAGLPYFWFSRCRDKLANRLTSGVIRMIHRGLQIRSLQSSQCITFWLCSLLEIPGYLAAILVKLGRLPPRSPPGGLQLATHLPWPLALKKKIQKEIRFLAFSSPSRISQCVTQDRSTLELPSKVNRAQLQPPSVFGVLWEIF